jgi:O-antigen/teichoic acid export membrane protein
MFNKINSLAKNKFIQGGAIITISSFIGNILNYFFNSIAAKTLGPSGYGEITATFSYLVITSVPFTIGSAVIIRKLGESTLTTRVETARAVENWFWSKVVKLKFLLILLFFTTFIIKIFTNLSYLSSVMLILYFYLSIISLLYGSITQGLHLFLLYSLSSLIPVFFKLTGVVLVQFGFGNLSLIYIFILLGGIAANFTVFIKLRNIYFNKKQLVKKIEKRLISILSNKKVIITVFSVLGYSFLNNFDLFFIKKFFVAEIAGIYSSWSLFAKIILYLLAPVNTISYILFTDSDSNKNQKKMLVCLLIATLFLGIITYIGYSLFGRFLILAIFNQNYLGIIKVLPLAAIFGTFYAIITIFNNYLIAKNNKYSLIVFFVMPFYILSFFVFGRNITEIIKINIIFSVTLTFIYFLILSIPKIFFKFKRI